MNVIEIQRLRLIFSEILAGVTEVKLESLNKVIYFKHLDFSLSALVDTTFHKAYNTAIKSGLASEEDRLKEIYKEGAWTEDDERKLKDNRIFIDGLRKTRSTRLFLKKDIDAATATINNLEKEIYAMELKKRTAVGLTAESHANKKANLKYVFFASYKDKELSMPAFSEDEFDELNNEEIFELTKAYEYYALRYSSKTLKKIALSSFFVNSFYLCENNPQVFYGKPVVKLSFIQTELFSFGCYFKRIVSEIGDKVSDSMYDDPDRLIEMFEAKRNSSSFVEKLEQSNNKAVSIVGATKEDLQKLDMGAGKVVDLASVAGGKGGVLSMEELIKLQEGL